MSANRIDDKEYWEKYYAERKEPFQPSLFSQFVAGKYLKAGDVLIELGCGNGRDAVYFSKLGVKVRAFDQCENEIAYLRDTHKNENLEFESGDFTALDPGLESDVVYSRFTMHSISVSGQENVLNWSSSVLREGGYFLLEFRGKENDLCGLGEAVEGDVDAYIYDGHYRRFLDIDELGSQLKQKGFEIVEAIEEKGFSPFGGDDEVFARIIARKVGV